MKRDIPEVLVAEIGSTTTVVTAFAGLMGPEPRVLGQASSPTTVDEGDVNIGLERALETLGRGIGTEGLATARMLATSSAAGGLKMTVHGLVYDMTVRAAREAALGAGAIVRHVTAGELGERDLEEITKIRPNIILLAGGVDWGDRDTVLANARALARLGMRVPVVYAGNRAVRDEVQTILEEAGLEVMAVENVYPRIDHLQVEPARRAIQAVFERHLTGAPGLERVRDRVEGAILPTPGAVMRAAEVLHHFLGVTLVVVDVGGATTDVHSVGEPSPEVARLMVSPEPLARRTVEGDLGIVANAFHVADLLTSAERRDLETALDAKVEEMLAEVSAIPQTARQVAFGLALTECAARVALERHVGRYVHYYGPGGRRTLAEGKDLTAAALAIGTGGAFSRLPGGREVLARVLRRPPGLELWPRDARAVVDREYVMAAAGMLARDYPEAAARVLVKSLGEENLEGVSSAGS